MIPGHGRVCDEADVVEYRDMVVIIRDRIQDLIKKGMTLDQVKAAVRAVTTIPNMFRNSFVKAEHLSRRFIRA